MATTTSPNALDFSALIRERTEHFSGRGWVFDAIDAWLRDPGGSRVFLLTGGPGTGKTATAARLAQASLGTPPLADQVSLKPGWLAYFHFCQAGLDSTLSPLSFVQALSESLANRFEAFREALESQASPAVVIRSQVQTGNVATGANVTGVQVTIEIRGGDARAMFDQAVRIPLQALPKSPDPIVILVDSLDEAFTFNPDTNIARLLQLAKDFPPQVRFVLTSRPSERVLDLVGQPAIDVVRDAPPGADEVKTYASARLAKWPQPKRDAVAALVADKSRGNFLFAYHVLNGLERAKDYDVDPAVLTLPDELEDVYRGFLERELASSRARWSETYRPLLGAIVVARGDGLTRAQLIGITALADDQLDDVLDVCKEYLVGGEEEDRPYRVYHQSFRDFLLSDAKYHVYPAERHADVASYLVKKHGTSWKKCQDDYALRFTPVHLVEAARGSESKRDALVRTVVELAENEAYRRRCATRVRDVSLLHGHMLGAIRAASWSEGDDMLPWLARAARASLTFREEFLDGKTVVELAERGEIEAAETRLSLFPGFDRDWQAAAALVIAWLAVDSNPAGATTLSESAGKTSTSQLLTLLRQRVEASLRGEPSFGFEAGPPHSLDVVTQIVRRFSGQVFDAELLTSQMNTLTPMSWQQAELLHRGYAAQMDGPALVNSARQHGEPGTQLLDLYVDAHAGYNYVEYRNNSLFVLAYAVLLHHPDQRWVRERLKRILSAALTKGGADFEEMSPVVATVLLERARGGAARAFADGWERKVLDAAGGLPSGTGSTSNSPTRTNDSWSTHKRRLASAMELEALGFVDPMRALGVWQEIRKLEDQNKLDGFSGFQAPADLRLADALLACRIADDPTITDRLERALRWAHHIQDYRFCARLTARCNTLGRWHRMDLHGEALEKVVERLVQSPTDSEFAADHTIGEEFRFRDKNDPEYLPVAPAQRADTLEKLADVFQRPAVELLRLNPGSDLSTRLVGVVKVPDPGLVPMIAIHLAARLAADPGLGEQRGSLVRSLVPAAADNVSALDSMMAYALLTADVDDVGVLEQLHDEIGPVAPIEEEGKRAHVFQSRGTAGSSGETLIPS